ncbi:MAG: helix-turn-helix domain-containing protein [Acidimicrobiia bacterium]
MPSTTPWKAIRDAATDRPGADDRIAQHRADVLVEIGLFELRRRAALSQAELAERLTVSQSAVSQVERSADVKVSTLRDYVEGLGGQLQLVATFDDGASYPLTLATEG